MPTSLTHPPTPPPWLAHWPRDQELLNLFAPAIREFGWRALKQTPVTRVEWDDVSLQVPMGAQRPTWRWTGTAWRRSCTCGYINDRCVHLYLATRILGQILKAEDWRPAQDLAPAAKTAPGTREGAGDAEPGLARSSTAHLELWGKLAPVAAPTVPQKFEVEVDFKHSAGDATLRFYLTTEGRRQLLRIQQVVNLCLRVRHMDPLHSSIDGADRCFLSWLTPHVNRRERYRDNLQVVKLPREDFAGWLEFWEETPGRFLDRATQQALSRSGRAAALHFELHDVEGQVEIAAVVTCPSGKKYRLHQIFDLLAAGQRQCVLDGQMLDFEPPVSWDVLREIFAKTTPRLKREHVPRYLPTLLEERLDLLRGENIFRREVAAPASVEVTENGADLVLHARIGGTEVYPDSKAAADEIRAENGGWTVTAHVSPHLEGLRRFLRELPLTREAGGGLRLAGTAENMAACVSAWGRLPPEVERHVAPGFAAVLGVPVGLQPELRVQENGRCVDIGIAWRAGDQWISDGELREALTSKRVIFRSRSGGWLQIDPEQAERLRQELAAAGFGGLDHVRLFEPEARNLLQRMPTAMPFLLHPASKTLAERLRTAPPPQPLVLPEALAPILRQYQKDGFAFLADRCGWHVGAILADDMGLGKTLQVLAVIAAHREQTAENVEHRASNVQQPTSNAQRRTPDLRPSTFNVQRSAGAAADSPDRGALVVCPASVVAVWIEQAATFLPSLRCRAYAGTPERRAAILEAGDWDVLVTNYALARNDIELLAPHTYDFVVLDEAQQIKNPDSQIAQAVTRLRTPRPLALTGTPIENRLLDLWSIMHFVNPGFLGSREQFAERYENAGARGTLAKAIAPVMLRRVKEKVARELPPRTEEVLRIDLGPIQRGLYDRELLRAREMVKAKGPMEMLAALTRLRQLCCDPRLLFKDAAATECAKLEQLLELAEELVSEGHSLLVFSQFVSMLELIRPALTAAGLPQLMLTGDTPVQQRAGLVKEFNDAAEAQVFLLSLKAAGTGLTLTKADYVIIFDPWWNPAVERQAIDRTHRIGQTRPVFAYRLVAADTVEDKILALQREKAELFAEVVDAATGDGLPPRLTAADFARLLEV